MGEERVGLDMRVATLRPTWLKIVVPWRAVYIAGRASSRHTQGPEGRPERSPVAVASVESWDAHLACHSPRVEHDLGKRWRSPKYQRRGGRRPTDWAQDP